MRLDVLLVYKGLCDTRQEAQEMIRNGNVLVNNIAITKPSKDIQEDVALSVTRLREYVSRGGDKLAGVFRNIFANEKEIDLFLKGKNAIDIGSSTGGFTDFLLQHGITSVTCVDVGTSQLHKKLKNNQKITLYENTDIRNFPTTTSYDVIVADLSFIPLKKIFTTITSFGKEGSYFFLLIKPQFEVGKGNTKKGIVKDIALIDTVVKEYQDLVSTISKKSAIYPCAIKGGDGNQEYFLTFTLEK